MVVWPLAFWRTCESKTTPLVIAVDYARTTATSLCVIVYYLAIVEGYRCERLFSRFCKSWHYFLVPTVVSVALPHLFVQPRLWPYAVILLTLEYIGYMVLLPFGLFQQVARDTPAVKRRWLYTLQMTIVPIVSLTAAFLWSAIFLPRGERAATDGERALVAFTCLFCSFPLVALANGMVRKMRDGPPLYNHAVIYYLVLGSLIIPRLLQAEMTFLRNKVMSSLLFALYDLVGDLAVPYTDMLQVNVTRWLTRPRNDRSAKPAQKIGCPSSECESHTEHIETMTSSNKGTAASISRLSSGEPRHSSSEIHQSVMRMGRRMRSASTSLSSIKSTLDLQSNFIAFDFRPRYLRALRDQQYAYNQAESLILIFINLSLISMEQLLHPFSLPRLLERLGGLGVLVAIEMACEVILFMVTVRLHNLPMLRSENEPGVLTFKLMTLFVASTAFASTFSHWIAMSLLRDLQPAVYGDVKLLEFCPHSAYTHIPQMT
ncbi:unnamed protein product [Vitrella brassicaformis CCMP3155]|uniref:Uncharacterized protein n=1 Tax=Vitrella brassicaformis (strain CCMP3155) TaxID=1169540 RepID=A0A0G4E9T1_VITBC|nr:unnamed protein product [Vitrella brassicaformis CCMP3155]|eukprot:CEL92412.1 unnamed protein product [Vitrella brassicaformis CCMP3155]